MQLTPEQEAIIRSTGNIKINAVAGSGKTTTIIEYAKAKPSNSKILYIAFNRSVKLEAAKRFLDLGLTNVRAETAHSLAYKYIVFQNNYTVRKQDYKTHELVELLKLQATGEKHVEYVVANHILKFTSYFCNSDREKVQDLNYLDIVTDDKAKAFVITYYSYIEKQTRLFLGKMNNGDIDVTHDFYLKKFQLANPKLNYEYILFDEGQDASPAMLDIFLKQSCTKVIVGDTHQQIYGWRHAINSLEKTSFKTFYLSTSFRFSQDIANLATEILKLKSILDADFSPLEISGKGTRKEKQTKAVLGRTNLGLLLKAIEYITEKKNIRQIYFEGNINSYTYADEGASLYDVLNLYNGKRALIRDELIRAMKDLDELEDYIEKTDDVQLGMMVEIVREYGNEIPGIIKSLKDKHIANDEKENAEMIFSTVHRCKGMEYDVVQLVDDFISEAKLEKLKNGQDKEEEINLQRVNEEINLLYVAVTRTRSSLYIPESLIPVTAPHSAQIHRMKVLTAEEKKELELVKNPKASKTKAYPKDHSGNKSYSVEEVRNTHKEAYNSWSKTEDRQLKEMFFEGISLKDMVKHFGRTKGAIGSRIKKLRLEDF